MEQNYFKVPWNRRCIVKCCVRGRRQDIYFRQVQKMLFAETQRDKIVGEHLLEKEFYSFEKNHAAFLGNVLKLSDPSI